MRTAFRLSEVRREVPLFVAGAEVNRLVFEEAIQ